MLSEITSSAIYANHMFFDISDNIQDNYKTSSNVKKTSASNKEKKRRIKPNRRKCSYNNRFLRAKKRKLYFKTVVQNYKMFEDIEPSFLVYVKVNMPSIEKREKTRRFFNANKELVDYIPMTNRGYSYTKVFVTHRIKNTFVTVSRSKINLNKATTKFDFSVIGKISCGLIGYNGPKKSTVFARKEVLKNAGNFLASQSTSLMSIIFTSKTSRWNRKSVRDLCPNLSYIIKAEILYKRPHGYKKLRNKRRV